MFYALLRVGLLSVFLSSFLSGQSSLRSRYFSAEIANDVFFLPLKTDRYFTSGMEFEWGEITEENIMLSTNQKVVKRLYWRINQDLFTPKAIDSLQLMPNDRPFASYLVVSRGHTVSLPIIGFQLRRQWTFGVLGKHSQGGRMQNAFHGVINFAEEIPGWVHEVRSDLVLNYEMEVSKRFLLGKRANISLSTRGRVGTLYTDLRPEINISAFPFQLGDKAWLKLSLSGANRFVGYNATLTGGLLNTDERYRTSIIPHRSVRDLGATGVFHFAGYELSGGVRWLSPEFKGGLNHVWAWFGLVIR